MRTRALMCALLLAPLFALVAAGAVGANPPPAAPEGHRFLFVIDASAAMEARRAATETAVQQLVASGMNGELTTGDAFAIWPFRERVEPAAFPPRVWTAAAGDSLGREAMGFLKSLRYEGSSLFYSALVETFRVIRASRIVTVVILHDGVEMLQGTPFDLQANAIYREQAAALRKQNKPFVTVLRAFEGRVIGWSVGTGGEPVTIPPWPAEIQARLRREAEAAQALAARPGVSGGMSNTAPAAPSVSATAKAPETGRKGITPTPAVPKKIAGSAARPPTPAGETSKPAPTKPAPVKPTAKSSIATPAPVRTPAVPEAAKAAPAEVVSRPAAPPAAVAATVAEPRTKQVATATPQANSSARFLLIGAGLLVIAAVILWKLLRSRRRTGQPSLITRGMNR